MYVCVYVCTDIHTYACTHTCTVVWNHPAIGVEAVTFLGYISHQITREMCWGKLSQGKQLVIQSYLLVNTLLSDLLVNKLLIFDRRSALLID